MKYHGLLLGVMEASPGMYYQDKNWINIKRAAGAHKIATFMRQNGWDIEVLDYWIAFDFEEFKEFIESRITPDTIFIGISGTFPMTGDLLERAQKYLHWLKLKYPHVALIAGSKQFYVTEHLPVDYHLTGYGEYGLLELCKKLTGKESKININTDHGINFTDCDTYHPCYPQKDLRVRYEDRDFILPQEVLTLEWSRGCKFKCKFCSYNVIGVRGDYTRDMPSLYDEMMENYDRFGVQDYMVADETVNDSTEKLKAVCEQVKKLPFIPNMTSYIRGDLIAGREDDRKYLAEMGLWSHYYGIETLNHKSGKTIGKGMHPDKLKQGLLDVKEYFKNNGHGRYRSTFSMIVGLPYETEQTFDDGLDWIRDNFKEEATIAFPLYLNRQDDHVLTKTATSEFDRTWRTSGDFHPEEGTSESFGASMDLLPPATAQYVWYHAYDNPNAVKWSHDTFNFWTANKKYAEALLSDQLKGRGIINWQLYNFVTPGTYTWDEVLALKNDEYDNEKLKKDTHDFIENYKWKKLSI
jgi:hypothetical protein